MKIEPCTLDAMGGWYDTGKHAKIVAGTVSWADGKIGRAGVVSVTNSLFGATAGDMVVGAYARDFRARRWSIPRR